MFTDNFPNGKKQNVYYEQCFDKTHHLHSQIPKKDKIIVENFFKPDLLLLVSFIKKQSDSVVITCHENLKSCSNRK